MTFTLNTVRNLGCLLLALCCQFRRVLPLAEARSAARGLAALIDGLWLRGALSGDAFDTEQAQRIAYEYMDFQLAKQVS